MRIITSPSRLGLALPLALVMVACGDDGTGSNASASADPIAKYIGTYTSICFKNPEVTSATTGADLYEVDTLLVGPALGTLKAAVTSEMGFYSSEACSGLPLYVATTKGSNTFLRLDGSETVSGQQVEKVELDQDPFFPGIGAGTSFTVDGIKFTGANYARQTPSKFKELWRLDTKDDLFTGDPTKPLDSTGYPTVMQNEITAKKS